MERYHGTVTRCTMFTRGEDCDNKAVWSVLIPMSPGASGGGWERPACGRHLVQLIKEASERYDPGEPIEVRRLADA